MKGECTQTQCAFNKVNGHPELCPVCVECGCTSNVFDDDCVNCWNCFKDLGFVRHGVPGNNKIELEIKESIKDGSEL